MARCKDYQKNETCPKLFLCRDEGTTVQAGTSMKRLDQYCYYCFGTARVKKVGHMAGWTGSTPKWCPLGRDEEKLKTAAEDRHEEDRKRRIES